MRSLVISTFLLSAFVSGQVTPVIDPAPCPANSSFKTCSSMCESKCGALMEGMCIESCGPPKCQCNSGYQRDTNGACVLPENCQPQICPGNSTWTTCSSYCEPQCGVELKRACIASCGPAACQCNTEYERNATGSCVLRKDCGKSNQGNCPVGQTWAPCGAGCEPKCGLPWPRVCPAICMTEGACVCSNNTFRDTNGKCVPRAQCTNTGPQKCTAKCSAGQKCVLREVVCVRAPCPPIPTCVNETEPTGCAAVSCMVGQECVVDKNGNGKCQVSGESSGNCSKNEFFNSCTGCETYCGQQGPVMCTKICITPGKCRCKEGFFRNRLSGKCVTQNECDSQTPPTLTCATVLCITNTTCIETPNGPSCVPINNDKPRITCANVRCAGPCVDTPTGPHCQPRPTDSTPVACNLNCINGFECVLSQPPLCGANCQQTPTCIPKNITSCKMMKCTKETHCAMVQVQCFAPPCYPVPECVPNEDKPLGPCAVTDCRSGYVCIEETVNCVKAPCPGQGVHAKCVPTEPELTCANVDCLSGMICQMAEVNCTTDPCIPTPQCFEPNTTTICQKNEVYTDCAPTCEDTCHGINDCGMTAEVCKPGCKCATGRRRNARGRCTLKRNCYLYPGCDANEKYQKCATCEKKCGQTEEACSVDCRYGCGCVEGFARSANNNTCVPENQC
ncbi:unnamed protein product, partial [Mesorhabditis belari]|uniref:TIL domain-containing protein n=1 Tax=Mesorhabditis belari TaxID=2138241 RepID=A0AAF3EJF1_9BILA